MTWVTVGVSVGSAIFGKRQGDKAQSKVDASNAFSDVYERSRQQQRELGSTLVDRAIDSKQRQAQYSTFANAFRGLRAEQLGRQKTDTTRNLKFALARGGQLGGSVQRDANTRLGQEFADASIANEREVQDATANLRARDEQTRAAMKEAVDAGYSFSDAGRRTSELAQANLANVEATARSRGLADAFTDTAATYRKIAERAATRRGLGYQQARLDLYGRP